MNPRRRALLAGIAALMTKSSFAKDNDLPRIGLGTWQTFDVGNDAAARAPLREVLRLLDGNVVDSSPIYGSSESVVGELVAGLGIRERLFMATKVWASGRDAGIQQMATSFRRLRVEQMDLIQVHNLVDVEVHRRSLNRLKEQGRVRFTGITHYTASAYPEVERAMKVAPWDFLQINYSLAEREADERILPFARERALFRRVKGKSLPPWAAELGIASWAQYFLKWIVSHPAVACAIPATSKPAHMKDNLGAAQGVLPNESLRKKMTDYFDSL